MVEGSFIMDGWMLASGISGHIWFRSAFSEQTLFPEAQVPGAQDYIGYHKWIGVSKAKLGALASSNTKCCAVVVLIIAIQLA